MLSFELFSAVTAKAEGKADEKKKIFCAYVCS